jgi:cytochrome c biogenesis protein CcmG/thiol:disulfide interchange protein DsbE
VTAAASGDPHPPAPHGFAAARWLTLPLAVLLAACTAEVTPAAEPQTASPFAGCAALTEPPPSAPATFAETTGRTLPELELPCCEPCRTELPAMQQLADRTAGRLTVVGVDTGDDRESAASFGADHKIAMPTLYDREKKLIGKLGRSTLPVTIFLGDSGLWHVEPLPLDDTKLDELVRTWTGVTVTS